MLKLVISDDEGKKTIVPLVRDEMTIGRKEGNTIRLTERNVSRRHARIVKRSSDYVLEDLASYNGIVVNNARLVESRPIRHGDEIRIGDYTVQIVEGPDTQPSPSTPAPPSVPSEPIVPLLAAPPPAPGAPSAAAAGLAALNDPFMPAKPAGEAASSVPESIRGLRVVFLAPAGVPAPVMLDRLPMVMGRSEAADIALPFSSISREHARIFVDDDKLMIEDLGSSNGIQVNGEKCRKSALAPGDMVQLGVVEFRLARRGDSTVVIQKAAFEDKVRSGRKLPTGLIASIVGGGLVLGLAVVLAFNHINHPTPDASHAPAPNVVSPTPSALVAAPNVQPEAQPQNPPLAAQPLAAQPPAAQPEAPPLAAQPEAPPVQPPTPPAAQPPTPPVAVQPETPPAQAPTPPVAVQPETPPAPEAPPVQQQLANPRDRHARTHEPTPSPVRHVAAAAPVVTAPRPAAPVAAPPVEDNSGLSPMQRVQACRQTGASEDERNNCIINALRGHANSMQELGMLATTYQVANRTADATRSMRTYIQRFPQGPLVVNFTRYIESH